jgi:hypothetical protein
LGRSRFASAAQHRPAGGGDPRGHILASDAGRAAEVGAAICAEEGVERAVGIVEQNLG